MNIEEEEVAEIKQKLNNYSKYTISPSGLSAFRFSPSSFIRYKEREEKESSVKSYVFGSAFHTYILENDKFNERYVINDASPMEGMMGEFIRAFFNEFSEAEDNNFEGFNKDKAYKMAYAASGFKTKIETVIKNFENEDKDERKVANMNYFNFLRENKGKDVITSKEHEDILFMNSKIQEHKVASKLFIDDHSRNTQYLNEFDHQWKIEGFKFNFHGVMDRVVIDHDAKTVILVDLKTCKYSNKDAFSESCIKYNYDIQIAFYRLGLLNFMKENHISDYKIFSYIVACQKSQGYDCAVYSISDNDIIKSNLRINEELKELSWHFENSIWDYPKSYYEGNGIIDLDLCHEKERL